ncbi:MAG: hypothetical protein ACXAC5_01085 [Promethearchaeota archaeon]
MHGPILAQETPEQAEAIRTMKMRQSLEVVEWTDIDSVFGLLNETGSYITRKLGEQE